MRSRARQFGARLWRLGVGTLLAFFTRLPIRANHVLYESFAGSGFLCNPEAIFRALAGAPDFVDLKHLWVLNRRARATARPPGVTVVRYRSVRYFLALATSRYLVNNATFPPEFAKRPGQVYLNTWHGTPLKRMGYDMPDGAAESANTLRNFVSADFLLSQNDFMTQTMYREAYKLGGAFRGTVIESGYPRVDRQFQLGRSGARAALQQAGLEVDDRTIVLYAPTWAGARFSSPQKNVNELLETAEKLQSMLGDSEYLVLVKPHQVIHQGVFADPGHRLVPHWLPTNTVLAATDLLITDYSSIFFDYLVSQRPIVFYRPQSPQSPGTSRGEYFEALKLPGPVCATVEEVAHAIAGVGRDGAATTRRAEWRARFVPFDDGGAAARVIDIVFRGIRQSERCRSLDDDGRTSILLHLGSMNTNGITSSALNLLRALDHTRYDVSVIFNQPVNAQQKDNQAQIHPAVRQFHRMGALQGTPVDHLRRRLGEVTGRFTARPTAAGLRRMWQREWVRCLGDTTYDRVIDFDGYGPFWATLVLHSPTAVRSVWLHNQMQAETHRLIRGKARLRLSLTAVFRLYRQFDALVSVSPALADVNRTTLAAQFLIDPARFVSARNLIRPDRIVQLAREPIEEVLVAAHSTSLIGKDPALSCVWFVTLGRFSPEKNQERLIRAFALVHSRHPIARLMLIGYGPLREHLLSVIGDLGLHESVSVVGPVQNPFPLLGAADCFVLSSDYEGQPMVLLEAAALGLPIVTVAFDTIADSLRPGDAVVVDRTVGALADGMMSFIAERQPPPAIDFDLYANEALSEFERATSRSHQG